MFISRFFLFSERRYARATEPCYLPREVTAEQGPRILRSENHRQFRMRCISPTCFFTIKIEAFASKRTHVVVRTPILEKLKHHLYEVSRRALRNYEIFLDVGTYSKEKCEQIRNCGRKGANIGKEETLISLTGGKTN